MIYARGPPNGGKKKKKGEKKEVDKCGSYGRETEKEKTGGREEI